MIYKVKDGFIIRELGGNKMAVPVGKQTSEIHGMIALSESGALLWEVLENGADLQTLAAVLTDNYEIDEGEDGEGLPPAAKGGLWDEYTW